MRSRLFFATICLALLVGCSDDAEPTPEHGPYAKERSPADQPYDDTGPGEGTPTPPPFDPCAGAMCNDPFERFRDPGDPIESHERPRRSSSSQERR